VWSLMDGKPNCIPFTYVPIKLRINSENHRCLWLGRLGCWSNLSLDSVQAYAHLITEVITLTAFWIYSDSDEVGVKLT
jgi:hypothetical protein